MTEAWKNKLYFGDNLDILRRYISDDTIDLIYLDPLKCPYFGQEPPKRKVHSTKKQDYGHYRL